MSNFTAWRAYLPWLLLLVGLAASSQSLTRHTASSLGPTGLHGPQATWGCLCGPPAAHCCHSVFLLLCPSEQHRFIFTITVSAPTPGKFETKFYIPFAYVYMWGYVLALVLVCTEARRGSEVGSLELELKVIVNCATWKLGSELLILKNSTLFPAVWETF